ncbi:MAG TPA: NHL repeat-containing protein [Acidimicrobiia bacterium]|nr:NHL repeat-containing protein [Acidimicrobiia bacterium]
MSFGSWGSADGDFDKPCGIAVDGAGLVYVADAGNGRVQVFDAEGRFLRQFGRGEGGSLKKVGRLVAPARVAIDGTGTCYVTDVKLGVLTYDSDGHYLGLVASRGGQEGQVDWPRGIHLAADGNLWVVDSHYNRVLLFDRHGQVLLAFGTHGSDPEGQGRFERPSDLAIDAEGCLWVTDTLNNRIQKFDSGGRFLAVLGTSGSGMGEFLWPRGSAIDGEGRIYVVERMNHRVQALSPRGEPLGTFGSVGKKDGQFTEPYGIAIHAGSQVYVTDNVGSRVQRFSPSEPST